MLHAKKYSEQWWENVIPTKLRICLGASPFEYKCSQIEKFNKQHFISKLVITSIFFTLPQINITPWKALSRETCNIIQTRPFHILFYFMRLDKLVSSTKTVTTHESLTATHCSFTNARAQALLKWSYFYNYGNLIAHSWCHFLGPEMPRHGNSNFWCYESFWWNDVTCEFFLLEYYWNKLFDFGEDIL